MAQLYRGFGERLLAFIIFSGFSIMASVGVYLFMFFHYPYPIENFFIHSIGLFFLGGAVFNMGFEILLDADEVTDTGWEYLLIFGPLLLLLVPIAVVLARYLPLELVIFAFGSFFSGCCGCFVLLSEKTVRKARRKRIFIR